MADHIDALVQPHGDVLCKAILGLQKMTPTPATERLIRSVTWHIQHEECPQLAPKMITAVLFGLQNMTLADAIIDLLWAVSSHIFSLGDQRFSSGQVASCSFGMRYMNSDLCTDMVLWGIAQQVQLLQTERFSAKEVCMTIGSIQNMPNNDCTRLLLKSMEEHVKTCHQFNLVSLSGVVSGLRGQSNSPYVPRIIDALIDRIADLDLTISKGQQGIDFFMADILNSINVHFSVDSPIKREHVLRFVSALLDKVYPGRFNVYQLRQLATLDELVIELISPKLIKGNRCDLHGCSFSLAATIVCYSLDQFLTKHMQSSNGKIIIVFGRNSHSLQNTGRMKTVVEQAVENRLSPARSNFNVRWEEPFVVIQSAK